MTHHSSPTAATSPDYSDYIRRIHHDLIRRGRVEKLNPSDWAQNAIYGVFGTTKPDPDKPNFGDPNGIDPYPTPWRTTWRDQFTEAMRHQHESWEDVICYELTVEQLQSPWTGILAGRNVVGDNGFYVWTKNNVYAPIFSKENVLHVVCSPRNPPEVIFNIEALAEIAAEADADMLSSMRC